ncbi:MAG TPA: FTR1 family protein [Gemmatimonadaceae bacterium]|nr:FTR1 family protein [Gemmatimonadaceae bacterium]
MKLRAVFTVLLVALMAATAGSTLWAQEGPAKRLSSIVGVAVEEYGKAIDADGKLISDIEYDEAVSFLKDAKEVAARLSGARAAGAQAVLDSLTAAVIAKRPPQDLLALHERFAAALGTEGALDMPTKPVSIAEGKAIYDRSCASCHGALGKGDGPAARGMTPPPPAIGTRDAMHDVSPALMYRIVSVGIAGTPMAGWAEHLSADERWNVVAYLNSLRSSPQQVVEGEGLYTQRCVTCHGATGSDDGPSAQMLSKLPPELGSFAWQAERSDADIAGAIRGGAPGTAMPASRDLSDAELATMVAYVRTLAGKQPNQNVARVASSDGVAASREVLTLLDEALAAARAGRTADAGDRAFDAYIAFEPLETPARAKSPGLVANLERHFADFKGAVKSSDVRRAEQARDAIAAGLPTIIELTRVSTGPFSAFLQSFLIILREGFEAILVIGAVVAFLLKTGHRERLKSIWVGVGAALVASAATAVVLATVLRAVPASREVIEGLTMLIAVGVLFSVSYWLISKVEAAKWQQFIRTKVSAALEHGGGKALAFVAFLAVYREGAETALFYQALFNEGNGNGVPISVGIVVGFAVLAVVFTLFYRFGVRIPLRPFFATTSVLLYYMAFVFMGKGIRELQEGNLMTITVIPGFPHVEALGLFPSVETILGQALLIALFVFALAKTFWPRRAVTLPTIEPATPSAQMDERVEQLMQRVQELESKLASMEIGVRVE